LLNQHRIDLVKTVITKQNISLCTWWSSQLVACPLGGGDMKVDNSQVPAGQLRASRPGTDNHS